MPTVFDQPNNTPSNTKETKQTGTSFPTPPGIEMSEIFPGVVKPIVEETVISWKSPSRPFKKRQKKYFSTLTTIVLLLTLILVFSGQMLAVAVVLAVAFMTYVSTSIPPHEINHSITTYGFRLENELYHWEELGRFWFEEKFGQIVLKIEVYRFPNRLTLIINNTEEKAEIKSILSEVLLNQKPKLTAVEKASEWLQKKFPLELEGA